MRFYPLGALSKEAVNDQVRGCNAKMKLSSLLVFRCATSNLGARRAWFLAEYRKLGHLGVCVATRSLFGSLLLLVWPMAQEMALNLRIRVSQKETLFILVAKWDSRSTL